MRLYHFDIRNDLVALADKRGRHCADVLEAMALAKAALETVAADGMECAVPWIEIADEAGNLVAVVHLDERRQ